MTLFYVTCRDEKLAEEIATSLLTKKLIACANMWPMKSFYTWKGKQEKDDEVVLILKTTDGFSKVVEEEVKKIHSYETPCIIQIEAKANQEFEKWVMEEVGKV